ncbi:hypothetical protein TNCV_2130351 [Trichonephila clavipes]|nr:hypothetical protein TNCV_2130351 [Trichonephila clavipes]
MTDRQHISAQMGELYWIQHIQCDGLDEVVRCVTTRCFPFIRVHRDPTFKQDNERPYAAGIVRTFLDTENVRLLSWPARSPDLSSIINVWFMCDERLARHPTPITTFDELR